MSDYKYVKANAFTSGDSLGNPAAFIDLGGDVLAEREMLEIAREHKGFVSEVVFVNKINGGIKLTYYSSECEVAFCGHGTIATMYSLIKDDPKLMAKGSFSIDTNKKGALTVYNKIPSDDAIFISAPDAVFYGSVIPKKEIAKCLGFPEPFICSSFPVDMIDAGLRTLIVPIDCMDNEISTYPSKDTLERFCVDERLDIILVFSMETSKPDRFAHTRVFAPKFGYLEDPATGSGNSAFGHYLLKNKLWDGQMIRIEQGGARMLYNEVKLLHTENKVLFGGKATVKINGTYHLQ